MKKVLVVFIFLIIAVVILFIVLGHISKSGEAAGLVQGKLLRCPDKPNCMCSEQKDDIDHYIAPIILPRNTQDDTLTLLKDTIQELGGDMRTEIGTYLAATFSSAIFGFVDDFEMRIDSTQKVIHIRSASRAGYGDLGVNKKRAELFKDLFYQKVKKVTP